METKNFLDDFRKLEDDVNEIKKRKNEEIEALCKQLTEKYKDSIVKVGGKYYTKFELNTRGYNAEPTIAANEIINDDMVTSRKREDSFQWFLRKTDAEFVNEVNISNEKFKLLGCTIDDLAQYLEVKGIDIKKKNDVTIANRYAYTGRVSYDINLISGGLELSIKAVRNLKDSNLLSTKINLIKKLTRENKIISVVFQEYNNNAKIPIEFLTVDPNCEEKEIVLTPLSL